MRDPQAPTHPTVRIDAARVVWGLMIATVMFFIGAVVTTFIDQGGSDSLASEVLESLRRLFNPDLEANLTTWFATALLLTGAVLTALVANAKRDAADPLRYHWTGLAAVLLIMSMDEAAQIHEMLIRPTQQLLGVSSSVGWVWALPALVVVAALALSSLRLLRAQTSDTRRLLQLSFFVFLSGAVGVEIIGSVLFGETRPIGFELAAAVEELLEMSGAVIFIGAILGLLAKMKVGLTFDDTEQNRSVSDGAVQSTHP